MAIRLLICWGANLEQLQVALTVSSACGQVFEAVAAAVGDPQKVGIRLSPFGQFLHKDMDPETVPLNLYVIEALTPLQPLYLHYIEPRLSKGNDEAEHGKDESIAPFRKAWKVRNLLWQPCLAICI